MIHNVKTGLGDMFLSRSFLSAEFCYNHFITGFMTRCPGWMAKA